MPQYQRLRELLANETFPHVFPFKFVGKLSDPFEAGVRALETQFPRLVLQSRRQSKNQKHLSLTYTLEAESAEVIIEILRAIAAISDVLFIL